MFEPEDILAGVEPVSKEPLRPRGAISPTVPGRPSPTAPISAAPPERMAAPAPASRKKLFLIVTVVVLLLILGAGVFLAWRQFTVRQALKVIETIPAVVNMEEPSIEPEALPPEAPSFGEVLPAPEEEAPPAPLPMADSDFDGLSDEEEITLGTDPAKIDTDDDELTDREETKIYNTNPLNPDTDEDTFLDGREVKAGYNPKGPGRLLELPQ